MGVRYIMHEKPNIKLGCGLTYIWYQIRTYVKTEGDNYV